MGLLALGAPAIVACGKSDSGTTTTVTTTQAAPAPKPVATTPPAKPATATKLPDIMTSEQANNQFKADKASMMGQKVKIKGYYMGYTKQGDQLNVDISPQPDVASKGPLCIFPASAKAALDKVSQKSTITASGTVEGDFFGRPKLTGCKLE
ncbi:Hypothetical protein A7982_01874 [Minicystis rosea]|nr:Hypothetical protein A7982_01874 [Minicystis rosea]